MSKLFYTCTNCGHTYEIPDYPTECLTVECPVCTRTIGDSDRDEGPFKDEWQVCESCGQDKPHVEPYRIDSRPDGVMLCDECYEGCMTEGNVFILFEKEQ